MKEETYIAADGANIKYFVTGKGEALLCMHGSGREKELWINNGWVCELKKHFKVIAMDIRGFGHSSVLHDEQDYQIEKILGDIKGIMKACNVEKFKYLGHSYGATIGAQAIRAGLPITKAVLASGSMSPYFFKEICPDVAKEYHELAEVKRKGEYDKLMNYSKEDVEFIKSEDMEKFEALFTAWSKWKPVEFEDVRDKVSIYSGTLDDNKEMIENTTINRGKLLQYGIDTKCFDGLRHEELVTKVDLCLPWALEHLL